VVVVEDKGKVGGYCGHIVDEGRHHHLRQEKEPQR
jgi:hypothetical protein